MQSNYQDLLTQIKIYKAKVTTTQYELQNYIKYLDQVVFKRIFFFCSPNKVSLTPSFQRAYKTLNDVEKADYYISVLKIIYQFNGSEGFVEDKKNQDEKFQVVIRRDTQNRLWKKTVIFLHYDTLVLQIEAFNGKINLMNYIIRKSKSKNKNAFVLQSTRAECEPVTLRIAHSNDSKMQTLLSKIKLAMRMGLRKKIARMMQLIVKNKQLKGQYLIRKEYLSMKLPNNISLQKKTIRQILKSKTTQLSSMQIQTNQKVASFIGDYQIIIQLDNFQEYEQIDSGYFIHKTKTRIRKVQYYNSITISLQDFDQILFNHQTFKYWNTSLFAVSLIGDVPKLNIKFYHQIDVYKDQKEVDFVYTRHRFEQQGMIYFIDRSQVTAQYGSYENNQCRGKIEYGVWRIKHKSKEVIQLIVQFQVSHLLCTDIYQAMSEHIGQLEKIPVAKGRIKKKSKNNKNNDFFSVNQSDNSFSIGLLNQLQSYQGVNRKDSNDLQRINDSQLFYSIRNSEIEPGQSLSVKGTLASDTRKHMVKAFRYQINPHFQEYKLMKQLKNGCFFDPDECVVSEKGDLLFTNQQKIAAQGGVIKSILKKIGANIFTGKSILNISLPIQIFATDTNLQRLCRSMAYAPHFLQKKANLSPLQKMKAALCFAIGNLLLYIEMAKPFNPILGQTYQGFIDGCPIYGEQISHHPPISSLLLVGRGYRVQANVQAKVDLGLNSASGLNDGTYHITFGNENLQKSGIIFTSPPGQLSGVVYGERKLNIINKSRYLDLQNRLFCELSWGQSRGGNTVGRYHDYVEGKIVQLFHKPTSNIQKIKQSEKDRVLGHITGRWTEFLYFNGEPIFQVNKLQPYRVIQQQKRLLSDSYFRQDRLMLQKQKYKEAQSEKERLEQLQRRDRKLRKQKGV